MRAIRLGYEVEVQGRRLSDGSVLAKRVEVGRNRDTELDMQLENGRVRVYRAKVKLSFRYEGGD